ncbi:MAG: metallophosphoesterase family protein [Planctomycetota bacterium]
MKAIISDIHANLEALTAVIEDIDALGTVVEIICLGDIIGYGPSPCECLDLLMPKMASLMGNHEDALLHGADNFNPKARAAIDWTRRALGISEPKAEVEQKRVKYLNELSQNAMEGPHFLVHASPRFPIKEYIIPTDPHRPAKLDANFELFSHICFVGHSHIPGVMVQESPGRYTFYKPESLIGGTGYLFDTGEKAIVNVGSVGQPRDRNPDACYVTFDDEMAMFRRVKYDVAKTRAKVYQNSELPHFEGDRLIEGR